MKLEKRCRFCERVIILDYLKYLEENPNQAWLQCPYCFRVEKIR
jgi:hypothetical protein